MIFILLLAYKQSNCEWLETPWFLLKWKRFPHYCLFVMLMLVSHKRQVMWNVDGSFNVRLNKLRNTQSRGRWIEICWLLFDVIIMCYDYDDVIKWKHFRRHWAFVWGIHRQPVNCSQKGQWREALIFSLICAWTNGWANNRDAGDLRRHRVYYDVTVVWQLVVTGSTAGASPVLPKLASCQLFGFRLYR